MNSAMIEQYAAGADVPLRGIAGLSGAQLHAFPVPNTWSIQQIVIHLMDSDLIASDRMKRVIAEDRPLLIAYNESRFATNLCYDELNAAEACEVFRLNRRLTAEILRRQPAEAFARVGIHNEKGCLSLGDLVQSYVKHLDHHMKFLDQKRALLMK